MQQTQLALLFLSACLALGVSTGATVSVPTKAALAEGDEFTPLSDDPYATLQVVWRLFDVDEDGAIDDFVFDLMEAQFGSPLLIWPLVDYNQDHKVSANEVIRYTQYFGSSSSLAAMDLNGNRVFERGELIGLGIPRPLFDAMDANSNGALDGEDVALLGTGGRGLPEPCHMVVMLLNGFTAVDGNADGQIDFTEAMAGLEYDAEIAFDPAWIFDAIDVNRDGGVTREELAAASPLCMWDTVGLYHPACPLSVDPFPALRVLWGNFDLDGDGGLDAAEAIPFRDSEDPVSFVLLDLDHNGRLSPNEILWEGYIPRARSLFYRYDFNHNQVLEAHELTLDRDDPLFTYMDANGNGAFDCEDITQLEANPAALPDSCHGVTLLLERYAYVDTDADNKLSASEAAVALGEALAPEEDVAALLAYLDEDSDGILSVLELKEAGGLCMWTGPESQTRPCKLPINIYSLVEIAWPILDGNDDLHLSLAEIQRFEPAFARWMFDLGDGDRDGLVSVRELIPVLPLLPVPLFGRLEINNNRLLEYEEVQSILDYAAFDALDSNGNHVIDCGDRPAPRGNVALWTLCPEWTVLEANFGDYDLNADSVLSLGEVLARDWDVRFPGIDIVGLYAAVDLDGSGGLSPEELASVMEQTCGDIHEGELAAPANVRLRRRVGGNNTYLPGARLQVTVLLDQLGLGRAEGVRLSETLPPGWSIAALTETAGADTLPTLQQGGSVVFAWSTPPTFPARIVYEIDVPLGVAGEVPFVGTVVWRASTDRPEQSMVVGSTVGLGAESALAHTVDQNQDWRISLSELLRLIQLSNAGAFHCDPSTEDHYAPGVGDHSCAPHASDYRPRSWAIGLNELLRTIQFYNMEYGAYHRSAGTEDGFAPGVYMP